jgi:hypothetical protein
MSHSHFVFRLPSNFFLSKNFHCKILFHVLSVLALQQNVFKIFAELIKLLWIIWYLEQKRRNSKNKSDGRGAVFKCIKPRTMQGSDWYASERRTTVNTAFLQYGTSNSSFQTVPRNITLFFSYLSYYLRRVSDSEISLHTHNFSPRLCPWEDSFPAGQASSQLHRHHTQIHPYSNGVMRRHHCTRHSARYVHYRRVSKLSRIDWQPYRLLAVRIGSRLLRVLCTKGRQYHVCVGWGGVALVTLL